MKQAIRLFFIAPLCLLLLTEVFHACKNIDAASLPDAVSYNYDIRPILSDKCFNCHGPDANKREAGLRLDIASDAYQALKEHPDKHALVPGKPDQSELFLRISTTDTSLQMPLASSGLPRLTDHEIALIRKWISQGAKYEKHWAFTVPVKQKLPEVSDTKWPVNEIDYFILKKMEDRGIAPNEVSDKERLMKRVCMDLTGILPTPEETQRFVQDADPKAYEHLVDRLMAQPQYGEKMAISWMDIAR
ncbi:MAG: DUF1549 domain-containing protein, partial [Bacteroidota bacterium]|nr:DUF1549 domain-containing protein [Bacteroidota bacterium]